MAIGQVPFGGATYTFFLPLIRSIIIPGIESGGVSPVEGTRHVELQFTQRGTLHVPPELKCAVSRRFPEYWGVQDCLVALGLRGYLNVKVVTWWERGGLV